MSHIEIGSWQSKNNAETVDVGHVNSRRTFYTNVSEDECPSVPVGFRALSICDSDKTDDPDESSHRIGGRTHVSNIYNDTFTIHIDSLPYTKLYNGMAMWFKYASTDDDLKHGVVRMNNEDTHASAVKRITFNEPYATEPKVFVCISGFDISVEWSIHVHATDIDTNGFTLNVDPRGATEVHWAQVTWISFSANRSDMTTGTFSSLEENGWFDGQVNFTSVLPGPAFVFYAISMFDCETTENLGIRMDVANVSPSGFNWKITESESGKNKSVGGSYLAVYVSPNEEN